MRIDSLTAEQEAALPRYAEEWTKIGLCTDPADRPAAEEAVREMYRCGGLKPPARIVWCGSPMSMAVTRAVVKENAASAGASVGASVRDSVWDSVGASVRASVGASVRASVGDSVGASVGTSVWDSVGASVGASVRDSVWDSVGASVWDSVWDSVGASVWDSVGASVGASVRASVWASVRASVWNSVYGQDEAHWLGFFRVFHDFGLAAETGKLSGLWALAQSSGWALPHANFCWVSERPQLLKRDENGQLHSESGPAIQYPDGWAIHSWHGIRVPAEWIERPKDLTPKTALTWDNMEQRRAACEIVGWARILSELPCTVIDRHDDPQIGELVEVELPDVGKERFLRVRCGTGREFALCVTRFGHGTALECNAATYGWKPGQPLKHFIPAHRT